METILNRISEEPVDITYLGIGSAPHLAANQTLDVKNDQVFPSCLHDTILVSKKTMRIIHFDPFFDQCESFLHKYFQEWNVIPLEMEGAYHLVNDVLDIIIVPQRIEHIEHYWFFEQLSDTILNTKGKLLIQEYTGYSLDDLNKKLYQATPQKEKYKRRILLDMTFGTDAGCGTDMIKAQPFYDYNGDFLNFHFASDADVKRWVGISLKLDDMLKQKYVGKFLQTLNMMHVDYRRKLKGESNMYGSEFYTKDATPDEIMTALQKTLLSTFEVLLLLRVVASDKQVQLQDFFTNYKQYDPYKWYDAVYKVIRP